MQKIVGSFGPVRLRFLLSLLVLAALLPPIVLVAVAVSRAASVDQDSANAQFLAQSRNLASIFSSTLGANVEIVREVAKVQAGPDRMASIARHFAAQVSIVGADAASPLGWRVSNLHDIDPGKSAHLTLSIGIPSGEGPARTVEATMDSRDLIRAIHFHTDVIAGAILAVVDGEGRIIARSVDQDRFVGVRVPDWEALLAVGKPSGIFNARRLEGDQITFGFTNIEGTPGWAIVVGVPSASLAERWSEPVQVLAAGAVLAALTAIALAGLVAASIARPVTRLVEFTSRADLSEPPPPSGITEFESLRGTVIAAHSLLIERANHDELTRLANRTVLRERLSFVEQQAAADSSAALLYVDLDRFKMANDSHGHDVGDAVLLHVAQRLRSAMRPGDLAARIGGDEFAILLRDPQALEAALAVGGRVVRAMQSPFIVGDISVQLGASVGVVLIEPGVGTVDEIIKKADIALYDAKSKGRGRVSVYGTETDLRRTA